MIQFLDVTNLPPDVTRTEREYLDLIVKENDDPARQHSVIIRCWHEPSGTYRPARFFEPTDQLVTLMMSELAPLLRKVQSSPSCTCAERHQALQTAHDAVSAATTAYQLTVQTHAALKETLPRKVWMRLKQLRGQVFYSQQDFASAFVPLIQPLVSKELMQQIGMTVMDAFVKVGSNEDLRQQRLNELADALDKWHGVTPQRPFPPTSEPCPFCRLPYHYGLMEVLPYEQAAISRITQALVGAPVLLQDIPLILAALEVWLFTDDDAAFKKNPLLSRTMTGMFLSQAKAWIQKRRNDWINWNATAVSPTPNSPDSATSSIDAPPPPPPPPTPAAS